MLISVLSNKAVLAQGYGSKSILKKAPNKLKGIILVFLEFSKASFIITNQALPDIAIFQVCKAFDPVVHDELDPVPECQGV